jgi:superfamily I DNA and/or RNA helicase
LGCAHSNTAVDNLAHLLQTFHPELKLCRIGSKARMSSDIYKHISLEKFIKARILPSIWQEEKKGFATFERAALSAQVVNIKAAFEHIKGISQRLNDMKAKAAREVIAVSDVILATNTGIWNKLAYPELLNWTQNNGQFVIVMDEAEHAIVPSCLVGISLGNKLVMAGDPQQLTPMIKSRQEREGLGYTLFSRMANAFVHVSCNLTVQYRMTKIIQDWSAHAMYQDNLRPHPSVASRTLAEEKAHLLKRPENGRLRDLFSYNMVLIDTSGDPQSGDKAFGTSLVNDK